MKKGFTLNELLIVMTIIVIMVTIAIGTLNSVGIFNKSRDAKRKKDLARIKVAFEEYYNDKGCYPDGPMVTILTDPDNCGKKVFSPWLSPWSCDPNDKPYPILVESTAIGACPGWFKVYTNLENKKDSQIPVGWYQSGGYSLGGGLTTDLVNYGVSSPNVNWYDYSVDSSCILTGGCYYDPPGEGTCNSIESCVAPNCYVGSFNCEAKCRVSKCTAN